MVIRVKERDFCGGLVVKTVLPLQGARIPSLVPVGELRSHMPHGVAKKKKERNRFKILKRVKEKNKARKEKREPWRCAGSNFYIG